MFKNPEAHHFYVRSNKPDPDDWDDEVFSDLTVGRMLSNSFSSCLNLGMPGFNYWDILLGSTNALDKETTNREVFLLSHTRGALGARIHTVQR